MSEAEILAGNPILGQNWMGTILEKVRGLIQTKSVEDLAKLLNPKGLSINCATKQDFTPESCFALVQEILTKAK